MPRAYLFKMYYKVLIKTFPFWWSFIIDKNVHNIPIRLGRPNTFCCHIFHIFCFTYYLYVLSKFPHGNVSISINTYAVSVFYIR